MENMLSTTLAP